MIDIHAHVIFAVDDGAKTIEESIKILEDAIEQGITDIICTPHFRFGMFETRSAKCIEQFHVLEEEVKKRGLNINLYLGREVYYTKKSASMVERKHLLHLNQTKNVLMEFSYNEYTEIADIVYNLKCKGYRAVIAHIERYNYIKDIEDVYEIKSMGALIQVNASTICNADGSKQRRTVFKYIKAGLVDFVASDIHFKRINYMKKAYMIIQKKFGKDVAEKLFCENAKFLIEESREEVA